MLPRVAGEADEVAAGLVDRVPVDSGTLEEQPREVAQHLGLLVGLALQRAEHGALLLRRAEAVGDRTLQRRVWPELEEKLGTAARELVDRRREQHRLAHVAPPVIGIDLGAVVAVAGDGGVERHLDVAGLDVGERLQERVFDRLHLVGVEGVVDAQPTEEFLVGLELLDDRLERFGVAGDGDHRRAVDDRDLHPCALVANVFLRLGWRDSDGDHAARTSGRLLEAGAVDDDFHGIREIVNPGDIGCGNFANTVADNLGGGHAPGLPELGERHLQGEDRRLRDVGLVNVRVFLATRHLFDERPVGVLADLGVDLLDGVAEDRFGLEQLLAHRPPLGALAGEDEHDVVVWDGRATGEAGLGALWFGEGFFQERAQFGAVFADDDEALLVVGFARRGAGADVGERRVAFFEEGAVLVCVGDECGLGVGGDRQDIRAINPAGGRRVARLLG